MNTHTYFCEHCHYTADNTHDIDIHQNLSKYISPPLSPKKHKNHYIDILKKYTNPREIREVFNDIRIDDNYYDDFYQYGYKNVVVEMIQKAWNNIPFLERPLFYFGNDENPEMDVYYIYHKGKWRRETELQWTNELLLLESEDAEFYPSEMETVILEIFEKFTDNLLADIRKYSLKVKNYFDFQLKNTLEIIFNTKSKIHIIKELMNMAKVNKIDFYCH
jgi:hypothetical protein